MVARRPSRAYFFRKFVQRNRVACLLGLAAAISLFAGLGTSTVMYFREHGTRREQERLSQDLERERQQAQARANVSMAAVLLGEGRVDEADQLLLQTPLESMEPSREAADVFRSLGSRNAMRGRWQKAYQCFTLLGQANRFGHGTIDLLLMAATFLKTGDAAAYEKLRSEAIDRHLPARNSLRAEQVLKACMLTPADQHTLDALAPAAVVCTESFQQGGRPALGWKALALTLYHFRRGDLSETRNWANKTLSFDDEYGSRVAAVLCLTAMAKQEAGAVTEARRDLAEARRLVVNGTQFGLTWNEVVLGTWYSWVIAEILLEEATEKMEGVPSHEVSTRG